MNTKSLHLKKCRSFYQVSIGILFTLGISTRGVFHSEKNQMQVYDDYITCLKSVSIRSERHARQLLMAPSSMVAFQSFLQSQIRNEVVVVSTNIGMEVFYLSEEDRSSSIQEAISDYCYEIVKKNGKLLFKNNLDGIIVYQSFSTAIQVFVKYPQVFLAYSKKFLHLLKENKKQTKLVAILAMFYQIALENLKASGSVPHLQRIETLYHTIQLKTMPSLDKFLQSKLASVLSDKVHSN